MSTVAANAPVRTVPYFTKGTLVVLAVALAGWAAGLWRMVVGLEATTNLDDIHPWGIWIAIDVASGVALAAGGFTSSALVHVFERHRYHGLVRSALITAMLGYTFVAIGLLFDLGRWYNVWHPMVYWQGNSVLFEVGICVMLYLTVLYLEFFPMIVERFQGTGGMIDKLLRIPGKVVNRFMWVLILAGITLSCLHQSSLGTLMLIAPTKMNPLWYTPILPALFLMSAIMVGFPMIVFEGMIATRSFRRPSEVPVLSSLARIIPMFLFGYLAVKIGDLAVRDMLPRLIDGTLESGLFLVEVGFGVVLPMLLLLVPRVRKSGAGLFVSATLVVLGVAMNRINVFLVAYNPPYATRSYFPSPFEFLVTAGLIATLVLVYRFLVLNLPVLEATTPAEEVRR